MEQVLGHLFTTSSSSHFFNKTNFKQDLFSAQTNTGVGTKKIIPYFCNVSYFSTIPLEILCTVLFFKNLIIPYYISVQCHSVIISHICCDGVQWSARKKLRFFLSGNIWFRPFFSWISWKSYAFGLRWFVLDWLVWIISLSFNVDTLTLALKSGRYAS